MNANVSEIRIPQVQTQPESGPGAPEAPGDAPPAAVSEVRRFLLARGNSALADRGFSWLMLLCGLSIFLIVGLIAFELVQRSELTLHKFGLAFFYQVFTDPDTHLKLFWDPVNEQFSARPFVYGTLVSSFLSLLLAVPLAIGVAVFLTELLAAIPSVIYGLWAVFVLVPLLRDYVNPFLIKTLGWTTLFTDENPTGLGYLA